MNPIIGMYQLHYLCLLVGVLCVNRFHELSPPTPSPPDYSKTKKKLLKVVCLMGNARAVQPMAGWLALFVRGLKESS